LSRPEIDAIRDWLVKEGYPLEYETQREMARVGYRAWQGQYYADGEQRREIDVRALEPDMAQPGSPYISVVVECKNNSKPWLGLMNHLPLPLPGYGSQNLVSTLEPHVLRRAYQPSDADMLLNIPDSHAYTVIQTIAGPDVAYAAMQNVTKAAYGSIDFLKGTARPAVAWPVIVLGGSLYRLFFDERGVEDLQPAEHVRVLWRGSTSTRDGRALQVDVITRAVLPAYMMRLRSATRALAHLLDG